VWAATHGAVDSATVDLMMMRMDAVNMCEAVDDTDRFVADDEGIVVVHCEILGIRVGVGVEADMAGSQRQVVMMGFENLWLVAVGVSYHLLEDTRAEVAYAWGNQEQVAS
jgi:hypothetical protein